MYVFHVCNCMYLRYVVVCTTRKFNVAGNVDTISSPPCVGTVSLMLFPCLERKHAFIFKHGNHNAV